MRLLEAGLEPDGREELSVGGDAEPETLALKGVERVTVTFAGFKDGRGFSLGAMLRERGFAGELRAKGDLLPDHAPMLARSGFDSAELPPGASADDWRRQLASFSAVYQAAADGAETVWVRRAARQDHRALLPLREEVARRAGGGVAPLPEFAHSNGAGGKLGRDSATPPPNPPPARGGGPEPSFSVAALNAELRDASAEEIVRTALARFPGRVAMLSSFGAEAAVGLHILASVDPATPVLFLDTDRHFHPTLQYRDRLADKLGLQDLRVLTPRNAETRDARGDLWRTDPDACCALRKVEPLAAVAHGFDALITGRKRFHGGARLRLPVVEEVAGQIRINPLANWSSQEIDAYYARHQLPRHPLVEGGYRSIGCWPCTQPSSDEEDVRAGRWAGLDKSECGIHMPSRWVAAIEHRRAC
jgi:phosphoadenylyl-sulfate reductase (thioredoxin)